MTRLEAAADRRRDHRPDRRRLRIGRRRRRHGVGRRARWVAATIARHRGAPAAAGADRLGARRGRPPPRAARRPPARSKSRARSPRSPRRRSSGRRRRRRRPRPGAGADPLPRPLGLRRRAGAREAAQRNLVATVAALAKAGIDAEARVGDEDVVQAVEDQLQTYPADRGRPGQRRGRGGRGGERRSGRASSQLAAAGRIPPRRARAGLRLSRCARGRRSARPRRRCRGSASAGSRFSSSQRRSLLPLKNQLEPLSATIIP